MVLERREREGVAWGGVCGSDREDATEDRLPCTTLRSSFCVHVIAKNDVLLTKLSLPCPVFSLEINQR